MRRLTCRDQLRIGAAAFGGNAQDKARPEPTNVNEFFSHVNKESFQLEDIPLLE